MIVKRLRIALGLVLLLPAPVWPDKLNDQREAFLQAEKFIAEKNDVRFFEIGSELTDYPLYPYLRYLWIKDHLSDSHLVLTFLHEYKDTRYAGLLRAKWLDYLAGQGRWQEYVDNYTVDENSGDDCRWHWANYQTGNREPALLEAKRLWLKVISPGKDCLPLFAALEKSPLISQESIWQRFESAIENNHYDSAKAASLLLKQPERLQAENWLRLHQKPDLIEDNKFWPDKTPRNVKMFAHAVKRLASNDLEKAISIWDAGYAEFPQDTALSDAVERKFGLALLSQKDRRAYSRLSKLKQPDDETKAATVRAAVLEQNWAHVNSAIAGLTAEQRQQPQWRYWQARALNETGDKQQARTLYQALAEDRSYYGFLAADIVDAPYRMADAPVKATNDEIRQLSELPDFKACWEFKWLGKELEARRHWQFAIKQLPKEKLLVAAKLAQQWNWDQQAITTLVKADYWDDLALRFPLTYQTEVLASAGKNDLEPALIFGLMRQESMMDRNAESVAGAKGLMQLMPETAKKIAKTLQEPWQSDAELFNPETNVRYGGNYFKDLLLRFNNQVVIASAAYNAGPNRAKKWLPTAATVPADIWIETIPFKETRKYVSTVISYAIIYQVRLNKTGFKIKELMRDVQPG